jgi:SAM-dependent methyltransferase
MMMNFLKKLGFSIWYYFRPPWDTGISPPELLDFLDHQPVGHALDLGCGTGTNVLTIARRGWQVTGIDFAPSAIKFARRKARAAGVEVDLKVGDIARMDGLDDEFNLILDIGCLHSLAEKDRIRTIGNVARMLAPRGTYLLYGILSEKVGDSGPGFTPGDLTRLANHFLIVQREDGLNRGTRPAVWLRMESKKE